MSWIVLVSTAQGADLSPVETLRVAELGEASGAAWDGDRLWLADDDVDHSLFSLVPGSTAAAVPMGFEMSDLEALTWDGAGLWAASSGSRNKEGEFKKKRTYLLDPGATLHRLRQEGEPPSGLAKALGKLGVPLDPSVWDRQGNIEGLAVRGSPAEVFLGFRAPLVQDRAVVASVALKAPAPVEVGQAWLLELGGRGVRDLLWIPDRKSFLVLAGPAEDGGSSGFALYLWAPGGAAAPLGTLSVAPCTAPEALAWVPGSPPTLWVFTDEGDRIAGACGGGPGARYVTGLRFDASRILPAPPATPPG